MSRNSAALARIAARLYCAALYRWIGDEVMRAHVARVHDVCPLGPYFLRVARFVLSRPMTPWSALEFNTWLADADALEVIFDDAGQVLPQLMDSEDVRIFRAIRSAVKWLQHTAYEYASVRREPANDAGAR